MKNLILMLTVVCLTSAFASTSEVTNHQPLYPDLSGLDKLGGAYLVFAGKQGGLVSKKDIELQKELSVEGCAKGSRIFTYTLKVSKGGQVTSFKADSHSLTAEMQTKLKSLAKGDSFEFVEIKAYLPGGKEEVKVWGEKFVVG